MEMDWVLPWSPEIQKRLIVKEAPGKKPGLPIFRSGFLIAFDQSTSTGV